MKPATPLVRPGEYYRSFKTSIMESFVAVFLSALVVTVSLVVVGIIAAGGVHVNVAIESPIHPSDTICTQMGPIGDAITDLNGPSCNIPETTAKFVTGWKQVSAWAPLTFVGVLFVWFGAALGLNIFVRYFHDRPSLEDTLAVAGWGIVPLAVEALATLLLVLLAFARFPSTMPLNQSIEVIRALVVGFAGSVRFAISLLVAGWQGYIWMCGVQHVHGLTRAQAMVTSGSVTVFLLIVAGL